MPVKPEVQEILDLVAAANQPAIADVTPELMRAGFAALAVTKGQDVGQIVDHMVVGQHGEFTVRVYRPSSAATDNSGILVWFHGGGFVIGDLDTTDSTARELANSAGVVVASVDYHLAPEFPFPAAVDDAMRAVQWVVDQAQSLGVDPGKVAVGGDSAGGNLAAVVCQLARAAKGPTIRFQLLVYPVTDLSGSYPSMVENGKDYFLTAETMDWFSQMYLGGRDPSNPRVSPLQASDLSGLPPALVITAEYDPLRDEGEAYANALRAAGVAVDSVRFDGMIHGFFGMDHLYDCSVGRAQASAALRSAFG